MTTYKMARVFGLAVSCGAILALLGNSEAAAKGEEDSRAIGEALQSEEFRNWTTPYRLVAAPVSTAQHSDTAQILNGVGNIIGVHSKA